MQVLFLPDVKYKSLALVMERGESASKAEQKKEEK